VKILKNQNGMALVTALMLTMISLTIVMYLMLMVTAGTKSSGANKRYKTALEASYGGAEVMAKEVLPIMFTNLASPLTAINAGGFATALNLATATDSCLQQKLTSPPTAWSSACSKVADPKTVPDISLKLNAAAGDSYTVYSKIIDTTCSDKRPYPAGNCTGSDLSGVELDGGSGVTGGSTGVAVKQMPALYRIEVRAERTSNPLERSNLSILYAY